MADLTRMLADVRGVHQQVTTMERSFSGLVAPFKTWENQRAQLDQLGVVFASGSRAAEMQQQGIQPCIVPRT